MGPEDYKYININGISIAYSDHGEGRTILFVHGFATFSYTWHKLCKYIPDEFRIVSLDLKGHGYSEKRCDNNLAPVDQAVILAEFIRKMNLRDFILIGHSIGGAIGLISMFNEDIRTRVHKLVVLDSTGVELKLPVFIADLTSASPGSYLVKYANEDLMAWLVLQQAFYDETQIDEELVTQYGDVLRQEFAKECIVASARQIADSRIRSFHEKLRDIDVPVLIVWGEQDAIADLDGAKHIQSFLKRSTLSIIPECGHSPQEEKAV